MNCPACGQPLPPAATFCPACRERGRGPVVKRVAPPPGAPPADDPHERFFLITACLFAAGALAIPRLLRSKAFGPVGKLVLGTVAALQTALCIAIVVGLFVKGPELFGWLMRYAENHSTRHF